MVTFLWCRQLRMIIQEISLTLNLDRLSWPGMMREKSCLPVHKGLGLRMAGVGIFPSHEGRNISRFIICSLSMNTSLFVILRTAVSVSCTMPMTGLFDCGEMT